MNTHNIISMIIAIVLLSLAAINILICLYILAKPIISDMYMAAYRCIYKITRKCRARHRHVTKSSGSIISERSYQMSMFAKHIIDSKSIPYSNVSKDIADIIHRISEYTREDYDNNENCQTNKE